MVLFPSSFSRFSRFLKVLGGSIFILTFILLSPFWSEAAACPVTDGGVGDGDGSANGTLTINASTSWTPPATRGDFWDCTGKTVHVTGGATLTFSTVTTSGRFGYLKADNIIVDAGSAISSDGLGCSVSSPGWGFGPNVTTGICTLETTGAGRGGSGSGYSPASGSYGGLGGYGGSPSWLAGSVYGDPISPMLFGSSSGDTNYEDSGPGGGVVWLHATDTLTLDGTISARGLAGASAAAGAGSGGSILLLAQVIDGTTGALNAEGADGKSSGSGRFSGGGGGGRVSVLYGTDSSSWLGSLSPSTVVSGGLSSGGTSTAGEDGTVYKSASYDPAIAFATISDSDADYQVDTITITFDRDLDGATVAMSDFSLDGGYTITSASETSAGVVTLTVAERGYVDVERSITISLVGSVTDTMFGLSSSSDVYYAVSSTCPFFDGSPDDADLARNGSYTIAEAVQLTPSPYRLNCEGLDLVVNSTVTFAGSVSTGDYSHLRADDITLGFGGVFSATERGCQGLAQSAHEPGLDNICGASALSSGNGSSGAGGGGISQARGGGGGYGGNGGQGGSAAALAGFLGGTSYGSSTTPLLFGSTGGGTTGSRGGHAGGIVAITASGTFTWNGSILSQGGNGTGTSGSAAGGGGSGGSVYIQAATLAGSTGSVSAAGGNGYSGSSVNGGGGGGGRVAIYYGTDSTSFVSGLSAAGVAAGGTGPSAAAEGTAGSLYTSATYTAAAPEAIEGFTRDADTDGYLDAIVLLFTEDLDAASLATTDFSVTGYTITGVALTSGNVVTLSLQEGGTPDTSAIPATSIVGSISGATSGTITSGSFVMNDEAYPVAMSASYLDTNVNGAVDRVDIVFSETITFSYNSGDWTFPDAGSFNLVDTTFAVTTNTLRLTVTADAEETSSSTTPTVLYTNTANRLQDASGNFTATFPSALSISDAAAPAINAMTTGDANSDGYIDTLIFVWTENVDTNDGAPPVLADFGTITMPNGGTASSATISDPGGISNTVTLTNVTGQTNIFTGTTSVAINGITGQWSDGTNLTTNPDDSETVIDAASPIIRTDGANAPRYEDSNSDGTIDRIRLIFSENTTITYTDADWTITPNALTSADVSAVSSGSGTTTVYLTATAQSLLTGVGTGTVPTLSYAQSSGSVADATGNQLATVSGVNLVDFANPRLRTDSGNQMAYQDADANGSIDRVRLIFTEPVTITYVDANWVSVANSLTGFDVGALSSGNGTSTVYLTATTSSATTGVGAGTQPTLRFTAGSGGSIVDSASNALASIAATSLIDEALPILLTSRYRDINYNATVDRFDLTFSETMTVATCETGDYTLSGSDASGVSVASCSATGAVVELTPSGIPANDTSLTLALSYNASAGTANSLRDGAANGVASFSSVSLADATSPVPLGGVSRDVNSDGTVDRVVVSFSENVTAAHCDAADYTFSGTHASGLAISACSPSGQDISYTLTGAPVANTALSFSWTYTQAAGTANSLADDIGNVIPNVTLAVTDAAAPVIISGSYTDGNGDGTVDAVSLGFSEAVTVTYDDGDWIANARDLTGFDVTGLTSGSGTSSLVFSATSSSVTGVGALGDEPTLRYTDGAGSLTSATGETPLSISAFTLADNADPLIVSGAYQDDNGNGTVDLVVLSFTEPLDYAACEVGDFSFAGADGSGLSFSSCSAGSGVDGEFVLNGAPSLETTLDIDLSYNALAGLASSLVDSEGNALPSFSALSIDDEATPVLLSSSYQDANADGRVDRVALQFSEPVTLTYADGDWTAIANGLVSFDVTGIHSGNGSATLLLSATAMADRTGVSSISSQPQLSFTATTGSLVDAVGQAITSLSTFSVADAAAPVIISGSYVDSDSDAEVDRVQLLFTEETTINFALADWTVSSGDLTGLAISAIASGNGNALISFDASAAAELTGVGAGIEPTLTYLPVTGSVADRYANALVSSGPHSLVDAADPVLLSTNPSHSELHVDRDADVVLSFSEAMDINTFAYDISNAGVSEGITWDADERIATIDFVSTLPEETVITVEVTLATDYTGNGFSLLAGIDNPFSFTTAGAIINPVLTSGSTRDTDNDGKIDAIVLSIDQDINGLTVAAADFTVTGYTISSASRTASGQITLVLTEGGSLDTDARPVVQVVGSVDGVSSGFLTSGSITPADGAAPLVVSGAYKDSNADGTVDRVEVLFSEPLSYSACEYSDFSFGGADGAGFSVNGCAAGSGDYGVFALAGAPSGDTSLTLTFSYTASLGTTNSLDDAADNALPTFSALALADEALPARLSSAYQDANADGTVDRVELVFSEAVTLTYADADWTATAHGLTGFDVTGIASGNGTDTLYLTATASAHVTGIAEEASQPTLAFTATTGSLVDGEGSALSSLTTFVLLDDAAPVLRSDIESVYRDTSGNGVVDRVVLRFTEDVNATYDAVDWAVTENDLAGLTITSASAGWASTVSLTATADGVQTGVGLGAEPGIAFSPALGQIVDRSGNVVSAFSRTLVDDASPLLVSSSPLHGATGVALDTNIVLSFSETMDINNFSFSLSEVVAGESLGWNAAEDEITIEYADNFEYETEYTVSLLAAPDLAGNALGGALIGSANPFSFTTLSIVVHPVLTSGSTRDTDNDGKIDAIVLSIDQDINGLTVASSDFSVTGYTISSASRTASGEITLVLTEGGSLDTDARPAVQVVGSVDGASSGFLTSGSITPADGAAPLVVSGAYKDSNADGTVDRVEVLFSEPLSYGACEYGDFSFGGADGAGVSVASCGSGDDAYGIFILSGTPSNDTSLELTFTYAASAGTANSLDDAADNALPSFSALALADEALPARLSSAYQDANADGTVDRVELVFSEAVTLTYADADWTVTAHGLAGFDVTGIASGNGTDTLYLSAMASANTTGIGEEDSQPTLAFTATTGSLVALVGGSALPALSSFYLSDEAAPRMISGSYFDENADARVDAMDILFTEPVDVPFCESEDYAFTGDDVGSLVVITCPGESASLGRFTLSGSPAFTTYLSFGITYSQISGISNSIVDLLGNVMIDQAVASFDDEALPIIRTDNGHAPRYEDANGDGSVDRVRLSMTEDVLVTYVDAEWTASANAFGTLDAVGLSGGSGTSTIFISLEAPSELTGVGSSAQPRIAYAPTSSGITDLAGNVGRSLASRAMVDAAAPLIKDLFPDFGESAVATDSLPVIRFTEPMSTSLADTVFTLTPSVAGLSGVWSESNAVYSMTATSALDASTEYFLAIESNDVVGNLFGNGIVSSLTGSFPWTFTTAQARRSGSQDLLPLPPQTLSVTVHQPLPAPLPLGYLRADRPIIVSWRTTSVFSTLARVSYRVNEGPWEVAVENTTMPSAMVRLPYDAQGNVDFMVSIYDLDRVVIEGFSLGYVVGEEVEEMPSDYHIVSYIKSEEFSTIYGLDSLGVRRPFLNEQVFFTWAERFDEVHVLSSVDLAEYPIGSPMLPKAESILVKIQSDPRVYFVVTPEYPQDPPLLRHVPNELVARELFGDAWDRSVIDIEPTFFTQFTLGLPLDVSFGARSLFTREDLSARALR